MNKQTKTVKIQGQTYTHAELAHAIALLSKRGEWYDGENSTHVSDWTEEGDYTGNETFTSLIAEWDS